MLTTQPDFVCAIRQRTSRFSSHRRYFTSRSKELAISILQTKTSLSAVSCEILETTRASEQHTMGSTVITENDKLAYILGYLLYVVVASIVLGVGLPKLTATREDKDSATNAVPVRQ